MPAGGLAMLGCVSFGMPMNADIRKRIRLLCKIQRKYGFKENNADRARINRLFILQQRSKNIKREVFKKKRTNSLKRLLGLSGNPRRWPRKHHRSPSY